MQTFIRELFDMHFDNSLRSSVDIEQGISRLF